MLQIMVIFTYIRNIILKLVMAFKANSLQVKEDSRKFAQNPSQSEEDLLLNQDELKYLLRLIKDSTFQGKDIETIYNLTWKLQKAFLYLSKD